MPVVVEPGSLVVVVAQAQPQQRVPVVVVVAQVLHKSVRQVSATRQEVESRLVTQLTPTVTVQVQGQLQA